MSVLTLRLPDAIEAQLDFFAQREQTTKSALGRLALESFIAQKQRALELEEMVRSVSVMNSNAAVTSEMRAINQDFYAADNDAALVLHVAENTSDWWK